MNRLEQLWSETGSHRFRTTARRSHPSQGLHPTAEVARMTTSPSPMSVFMINPGKRNSERETPADCFGKCRCFVKSFTPLVACAITATSRFVALLPYVFPMCFSIARFAGQRTMWGKKDLGRGLDLLVDHPKRSGPDGGATCSRSLTGSRSNLPISASNTYPLLYRWQSTGSLLRCTDRRCGKGVDRAVLEQLNAMVYYEYPIHPAGFT
jgi:hypothetical protein